MVAFDYLCSSGGVRLHSDRSQGYDCRTHDTAIEQRTQANRQAGAERAIAADAGARTREIEASEVSNFHRTESFVRRAAAPQRSMIASLQRRNLTEPTVKYHASKQRSRDEGITDAIAKLNFGASLDPLAADSASSARVSRRMDGRW